MRANQRAPPPVYSITSSKGGDFGISKISDRYEAVEFLGTCQVRPGGAGIGTKGGEMGTDLIRSWGVISRFI
jgi:hypothetical protein